MHLGANVPLRNASPTGMTSRDSCRTFLTVALTLAKVAKQDGRLPSRDAAAFQTAAPKGQAIVAEIETCAIFRVAGLTCERRTEVAVRIDFVGGQLPCAFDKGSKLRALGKRRTHNFTSS
jgi:hypothetical protein